MLPLLFFSAGIYYSWIREGLNAAATYSSINAFITAIRIQSFVLAKKTTNFTTNQG